VEFVVTFPWNRWSVSPGIRGQIGPEYAGHYEKVGYKANLTETCGKDTPDPKIITHVSIRPANTSDKTLVTEVVDDLGNKGLEPKAMLLDNGYDSDENQQGCRERGIDFVCPPSGDLPDGLGVMDFVRTEDNIITFCPMGQRCLENIVHEKRKRTVSYFDPSLCRECPHSHDCPIKITKRKAKLDWDLNPAISTSVCPNAARLSNFWKLMSPKGTPESSIVEF